MRILEGITQGSAQWHAERATRMCASEAPAMMGSSNYMKRSDLLRMKAGGAPADVSPQQQSAFDAGHASESGARAIAERIIGGELYPCTGVSDDDQYLASFDGLTMLGDVVFEHKLISSSLAAMIDAKELSDAYLWQVDHQMMVSGAAKALFMASDGSDTNCKWMWIERDESRITKLIAGWAQFREDLASYAPASAPAAVGVAPGALPALRIELTGMVTASNLDQFTAQAVAVFDGIKTDLATDDDFANAEKTVGWCKDIEDRLDAAKQHALSQTASIDALFRAIDDIKERARAKRLTLEKLVKSRKDDIRSSILKDASEALTAHHNKLRDRLGLSSFPSAPPGFAEAMKGKRTIASLRDAVDTVLAHAKIAANETADRMDANLKTLRGSADASLFPDAETLATKEPADVLAIMQGRIAQAKAEAERRAEEARERIRREEQAKADTERRAVESAATAKEVIEHRPDEKQVLPESAWHAELTDLKALCRAIAEGRVPASLVTVNQAEANRMASALKSTMQVPGLLAVENMSVAARR